MVVMSVRIKGRTSHNRKVLSAAPDTICVPSGENDTDSTDPLCPSSVFTHSHVVVSHTRTVVSYDPDTMRLLSTENDTELT